MASSEVFVPMSDDVRLFVRTVGDGPRMLFIPNGMCLYEDFRYLADRRTMVFYDVRNRGRSEAVNERAKLARGVEQDVDDLDTLRRYIGVDRVDLMPPSSRLAMPCVTAFSTSGCSNKGGTRHCVAAASTWRSICRRSPNRTCSMLRN